MSEERRFDTSAMLSLAETLGRRRFIATAIRAAAAFAAAIAGVSQNVQQAAATVTFVCCNLCHSSTSCTGVCCWTWGCCAPTGRFVTCKECYSSQSACTGGCPSKCSHGAVTQALC